VVRGEGVTKFWIRGDLDPRRSLIDEKESIVLFIGQARLKPEEISEVCARYVPLLAVENEVITVADGRCLEARQVGAGA